MFPPPLGIFPAEDNHVLSLSHRGPAGKTLKLNRYSRSQPSPLPPDPYPLISPSSSIPPQENGLVYSLPSSNRHTPDRTLWRRAPLLYPLLDRAVTRSRVHLQTGCSLRLTWDVVILSRTSLPLT